MTDLTGILARLERRLGTRASDPRPLEGGITNRNYRVRFGGRDYVLRLPGKDTELLGIDREAERLAADQAASLGIGPELVFADAECSLSAYLDGAQPAAPDALRADPGPFARALRAFHDCAVQLPARFWVPDLLDSYALLLEARGVRAPAEFVDARALVRRIARAVPLERLVPCHDDLLPGNLLVYDGRALLVDWEYAGMGHPLFDLANLAVNNEFDAEAQERLLSSYYEEAPVRPDRRAALALMMLVSDAREAAWGVVQGAISDLEFDFAGYAAKHFERLERAAGDSRLEEDMRDAASA